jgi:hypothetical protein
MKKSLILFLIGIALMARAADSDIESGLDPTALTQITASQLLQMVANAKIINAGSITNGKGIILRSTIAPNLTANPRQTNWLWNDLSGGLPGTLKQYNGSAWVAAAFGTQSIFSTNIANGAVGQPQLGTNAVDTVNIANNAVTAAKIGAGQVLNTHLGAGVVSNANIADLTITGAKLAYNTLLNTNFIDGTIDGVKLQSGSVTGTQIKTNSITLNEIALSGSTSNQVMQTSGDGTVLQWTTPAFLRSTSVVASVSLPVSMAGTTNAHGLGRKPTMVYTVFQCVVAERGFAIGDEVDARSIWHTVATSDNFTITCDATNVYMNPAGGTSKYQIVCKDDNTTHDLTLADWSIVVHLSY